MKQAVKRNRERGGIVTNLVALLFLGILCALLYFARHPIMRFAGESWVVDEPPAHADAIVVLGDDNFRGDRATRAAEMYRQGVAPVVVASGRRLRPNAGVSELIEHDLVERGVPKEKIMPFTHDADNTKEEAEALAKLAGGQHWKRLVIVTSNYHTRRARYIFAKVFPRAIAVSMAAAPDGDFNPDRWWEKRKAIKLFVREVSGMMEAMWELRGAKGDGVTSSKIARLREVDEQRCCAQFRHTPVEKPRGCPLHRLSAVIS
jgi:uncharacterized SAM-binding protein YcdF (DUF218 family)